MFRYFDKVWPNQSIPHMMIDFRITCAILNAYHPGIDSDVGDGLEIAETMLARVGERNGLGDMVGTMGLNRKSASFDSIDGSSIDVFPQLKEVDLRLITLGTYQLRMAGLIMLSI
ncbi:unnamed protein product [Sphagnum jensenii]|uniref:Uncharacterized protein n=2 Tax=Sphagnum jensenii TaxID=128206 RepID=A0ABP1A4K5_9BRYO